jgi:hypothetical protein
MQDVTNSVSLAPFHCMQEIHVLFDSMQYLIISNMIGRTDLLLAALTAREHVK